MTKQEFLKNLRLALSGRVNSEVVAENINYYEDYINTEIRKGKSEEEVLDALGDPRLIARTIAETNPAQAGGRSRGGFADEEQSGSKGEQYDMPFRFKFFRLPLWMWLVLVIVVLVLVVSAVLSILSMILPVLLPILVVLFLVKLYLDWMR